MPGQGDVRKDCAFAHRGSCRPPSMAAIAGLVWFVLWPRRPRSLDLPQWRVVLGCRAQCDRACVHERCVVHGSRMENKTAWRISIARVTFIVVFLRLGWHLRAVDGELGVQNNSLFIRSSIGLLFDVLKVFGHFCVPLNSQ